VRWNAFSPIPCQIANGCDGDAGFHTQGYPLAVAAIGYHAIIDAAAVFGQKIISALWELEGVVGLFAILSIIIIFLLRRPEPAADNLPAAPAAVIPMPALIEETAEDLEKTRYQ